MSQYKLTVTAALAETKSKFDLAAALAIEIPQREETAGGQTGKGDDAVLARLEEARDAIVAAGGESRSVGTLRNYRLTALWVGIGAGSGTDSGWVPGLSFSAHNEARMAGLSYGTWAANPTRTDLSRHIGGRKGTDGDVKIADVLAMPQEDLDRLAKELQVKADADAAHRASVAAAEKARKEAEAKAAAERKAQEAEHKRQAAESKKAADAALAESRRLAKEEKEALAAKHRAENAAREAVRKAESLAAKTAKGDAEVTFTEELAKTGFTPEDGFVTARASEIGVTEDHVTAFKAAYLKAFDEAWDVQVAALTKARSIARAELQRKERERREAVERRVRDRKAKLESDRKAWGIDASVLGPMPDADDEAGWEDYEARQDVLIAEAKEQMRVQAFFHCIRRARVLLSQNRSVLTPEAQDELDSLAAEASGAQSPVFDFAGAEIKLSDEDIARLLG